MKITYISLDAVFDENFSSPLSMPELHFQGALRTRGTSNHIPNTETLVKTTGRPSVKFESYPDDLILNPCHHEKPTRYDHENSPTNKGNQSGHRMITRRITREISQNYETKAYFANIAKLNDITYSEYLYIAHDIKETNTTGDKVKDQGINLSDFLPEPRSLSHILRLSPHIKEKWGDAIRSELVGLYDSETFSLIDKPLPVDEIIPTKLVFKTKLNSYGGLDKLKVRICMRGDM